jgi:RNA polymerase sigma-70 factor, ECF subfamily
MTLLEPVHDDVARYVRVMTRDTEQARDLLGETLLTAFERFDTLRAPEAFLSFLFTIARRIHAQSVWRRRFFARYDHRVLETYWDPAPLPDLAPDLALLHDVIQHLPLKQREAVVLHELHGFSLEEIRELQGGTLSAVKMRLARARHKLEHLLRDRESVEARNSPPVNTKEADA